MAAVCIGVGAALMTNAEGTAAAAPDQSTGPSATSSSSDTARNSRTATPNSAKTSNPRRHDSKTTATPLKRSTAGGARGLGPKRSSPEAAPTPASVNEAPGAALVSPSVRATLGGTGVPNRAETPGLPTLPFDGVAESLLLAARETELSRSTGRPSSSPTPTGQPDVANTAIVTGSTARVVAGAAATSEAEREAADAAFNLSAGWIPVIGTVYNGLSLLTDLGEFSTALGRGDIADVVDEIRDMAIDVVGMVPIVGAPIASIAYQVFQAAEVLVNHSPNAVTDSYTMNEDTQLTGNVLANDTDADGDPLTAALNTSAAHGSVTVNPNGSFTYTPAANFYGSDSFSYTVGDGISPVSVGTVSISVIDVAEPPPPSAWTRPVNGYRITQEYGNGHTGIDLAVASGTAVYAAADGVIYFEGWGTDGSNGARSNWMGSAAGISILVQHNSLGVMTGYAHLSRTIVDQGQTVTKGQVIGYVGCTGSCTGPHLHFEVLPMPLNSRNGISGRVNPRNYLSL